MFFFILCTLGAVQHWEPGDLPQLNSQRYSGYQHYQPEDHHHSQICKYIYSMYIPPSNSISPALLQFFCHFSLHCETKKHRYFFRSPLTVNFEKFLQFPDNFLTVLRHFATQNLTDLSSYRQLVLICSLY